MRRRRWRLPAAVALAAMGGMACASVPPAGPRPSPFPGGPSQTWVRTPDAGLARAVGDLLDAAMALRGTPYQLGGTTPQAGFDCSGFVRYVFAQSQLEVPRTVAEQFRSGQAVARRDITSGDLVFFSTTGPGATHVGIVVDPIARTFVHAPGTGSVVRVERFDAPYWQGRMLGARRLPMTARPDS